MPGGALLLCPLVDLTGAHAQDRAPDDATPVVTSALLRQLGGLYLAAPMTRGSGCPSTAGLSVAGCSTIWRRSTTAGELIVRRLLRRCGHCSCPDDQRAAVRVDRPVAIGPETGVEPSG